MSYDSTLYKRVDIYKHLGEGHLAIYYCFEILPDGGFFVMGRNWFKSWRGSGMEEITLWAQMAKGRPGSSSIFPTIDEAIANYPVTTKY